MFSQNLVLATSQEVQDDWSSPSDENDDSSSENEASENSQETT